MGRVLGIFLAIVVIGGAGLFCVSPLIAFYDVRSSARAEDVEALAKLINFTSVRTSLKGQLEAGDKGVPAPAIATGKVSSPDSPPSCARAPRMKGAIRGTRSTPAPITASAGTLCR